MNNKLRLLEKNCNIDEQLKKLQVGIFELNKEIIKKENLGLFEIFANNIVVALSPFIDYNYTDNSKEHIKNALANVMLTLKQIQLHYNIPTKELTKIMKNETTIQIENIYMPKHVDRKEKRKC